MPVGLNLISRVKRGMSVPHIKQSAAFSPTQIAGCLLWLDAADATTITGTSPVTQWRDKSGNSQNATPHATGPQLVQNSLNSLPGLTFSGANTMKCGAFLTQTSFSAFMVVNNTNTNVSFGVWKVQTGSYFIMQNVIKVGVNNSGAYAVDASISITDFTKPHILGLTLSSSSSASSAFTFNASFDGTNTLVTGTSTLGNATTCEQQVGVGGLMESGVPQYQLGGVIYEAMIFNTSLSKPQAETIEGYLAQKWGLRSNLPGSHAGITSILYPTIRRTGAINMTIQPVTYSTNFSPTSIAGCTLWLDGADPAGSGVLPANNSTLSTWADKSGYGLNMTGASGQPSFLTTAFNGRPTVSFAATQDVSYQVLSNASTALFNSLTNLSVFIVMYIPGTTPNFPVPIALFGKVIIYMRGGSAGGIGSGNLYPWTYNGAGVVYNSNNYISVNNYYICCFQFNTNQSFFMNGDLGTGGPTAFSFGSATNIPIFIGTSTYNTSDGFNGYLSEILVYTSLVTSTQRQQVESYLGQKWGLQSQLPAGHLNATNPAGTPAIVREIYGQIKRTIIPFIVPWTPLKPLSSGVLPWHWFKGDAGLSTTVWINYGVSGSTASNVGTITLANYTQGGTQAGGTNNSCTVSPSGYWRWPGVYQTSYHATFAVFKLNSLTSGQTWTWKGNSTAGRGYTPQYIVTNSSGVFSDYILSQNAFLPLNGVTINPATQFYTHSMVWGSTPALSLVQVGSTVASPNGWTTDYGLGIYDNEYIGFAVAPAQSAGVTMTICELLLFALNSGYGGPVDLTAADVANVQSYLSKKWGV